MEWLLRNYDLKSEVENMIENCSGKVTCKEE